MTEAELKTKWCPHVRVATANGYTSLNKIFEKKVPYTDTYCIGSACTQYREMNIGYGDWDEKAEEFEPIMTSYCGLAGKPND